MNLLRCIVVFKSNVVTTKWIPESSIKTVEDCAFHNPLTGEMHPHALRIRTIADEVGEFYVMKDDIEVKNIINFKPPKIKVKIEAKGHPTAKQVKQAFDSRII